MTQTEGMERSVLTKKKTFFNPRTFGNGESGESSATILTISDCFVEKKSSSSLHNFPVNTKVCMAKSGEPDQAPSSLPD